MTDLIETVCDAFAWQRALGNDSQRDALCRIVVDHAHPDVWDANHVSQVRARTAAEIDAVLQRAEAALSHCRHRMFVVDPAQAPLRSARLRTGLSDPRLHPPPRQRRRRRLTWRTRRCSTW